MSHCIMFEMRIDHKNQQLELPLQHYINFILDRETIES